MGVKRSGRALSMGAAAGIGVFAGVCATVLGAVLMAYLMGKGHIAADALGIWSFAVQLAAAAAGAWIASALYKDKRLILCGIIAGAMYLLYLAMTAMFFGGQYEGLLVGLAAVLLGSGSAMLPILTGKGHKRKHKIPAYR